MAKLYDAHRCRESWRAFPAAPSDRLSAGRRALRGLAFVALFALMAIPLLFDLFH